MEHSSENFQVCGQRPTVVTKGRENSKRAVSRTDEKRVHNVNYQIQNWGVYILMQILKQGGRIEMQMCECWKTRYHSNKGGITKNARYAVSKAELSLDGYDSFPGNFPEKETRGIIVYVKTDLPTVEVECGNGFKESVWIKINLRGSDKLLVGYIYKSPSSNEENLRLLNDMICNINVNDIYSHVLILGDFNFPDIYWLSWSSRDSRSQEFIESLRDGYLEQMVDKPTRFRFNKLPSVLDLILVNDSNSIQNIDYLSPIGNSDHIVLRFNYKCYIDLTSENTSRLNYFKGNYEGLREALSIDWKHALEGRSTENMVDVFIEHMSKAINTYIPIKRQRKKEDSFGARSRQMHT